MCTRSLAIALLVTILPVDCRAESESPEQTLDRAVEYLWSKQLEDGSWRSEHYGVMLSGESLTPFVLYALLQTIDTMSCDEAGKVLRAARFIKQHLDDQGAIGRSDPDLLEYPVYSTAYALECFCRLHDKDQLLGPSGDEAIHQMAQFLYSAQYQEENGFVETDVAYGAWGFNAPERVSVVGHLDLAHTRRALEALRSYKRWWKAKTGVICGMTLEGIRAQKFLLLMQKHPDALALQPRPAGFDAKEVATLFDGGFYFSPVALSANKAFYDEANGCWRSYATATCDGLLALLIAGTGEDPKQVTNWLCEDECVQAAIAWLHKHTDVDYPQGVPDDHPEPWGDAIRFYHYSVRAEVYQRLGFPVEEKSRLAATVVKHQRSDGSFVNTLSPLMKEDDPLVCTSLVVIALVNSLP